jgi:hypothetical protein
MSQLQKAYSDLLSATRAFLLQEYPQLAAHPKRVIAPAPPKTPAAPLIKKAAPPPPKAPEIKVETQQPKAAPIPEPQADSASSTGWKLQPLPPTTVDSLQDVLESLKTNFPQLELLPLLADTRAQEKLREMRGQSPACHALILALKEEQTVLPFIQNVAAAIAQRLGPALIVDPANLEHVAFDPATVKIVLGSEQALKMAPPLPSATPLPCPWPTYLHNPVLKAELWEALCRHLS